MTDHTIEEPTRNHVSENPAARRLVESVVHSIQNEEGQEKASGLLGKVKSFFGKR